MAKRSRKSLIKQLNTLAYYLFGDPTSNRPEPQRGQRQTRKTTGTRVGRKGWKPLGTLQDVSKLPTPHWEDDGHEGMIYGPVRDERGVKWTDENGRTVWHSRGAQNRSQRNRKQPVVKQDRRKCLHKTEAGGKCQNFRATCPHHGEMKGLLK